MLVVKHLKSHTSSVVCLHLFCIGVEIDVGHCSPKVQVRKSNTTSIY